MIKRIFLTGCLVIMFFSLSAGAVEVNKIKETIVKHSISIGVDPALALSIAKLESQFCPYRKSSHGAIGLFQITPQTAKYLGINPYLISDNIKGGLTYYKMMYSKFGSTELALAAYNAGPGNVKKHRGVPPFAETKRYIKNVMTEYDYQKKNPDPAISKVRAEQKAVQNVAIPSESSVVKVSEHKPAEAAVPVIQVRTVPVVNNQPQENDEALEKEVQSILETVQL